MREESGAVRLVNGMCLEGIGEKEENRKRDGGPCNRANDMRLAAVSEKDAGNRIKWM